MLPVTSATVRLFLHILGATVWVGGQIALAGVVPVVRRHAGVETVRLVARRFQQIAWPAFALLLVTGVWNLFAVKVADQDSEYLSTLFMKLVFVALSGTFAALHVLYRGKPAIVGLFAALGLLFALAATFVGVQLHG
jgi:putative copper export protein